MNDSTKWLDDVRGKDSIREVARKVGTTHATLNRQAAEDAMSFEIVRAIARVYERPVLADLVRLGHLDPSDLGASDATTALRAAREEDLVAEVGRRLGLSGSILLDLPITRAIATSNVVQGPFGVGASDEDEPSIKQPPAKQRTAAKKGTRKGDAAPHAD
ncbi:hypothetical protein [Microbacterium sp. 77mftsu3.1]|uniref:hypothetical protein n=1 Tax=Microbacterium sp. 77mftsu3.1 TaxID=1761802 RepID=UPI000365A582|nr:hypothetical protein [Microbacterium sp. 77mftsu3.1]SDG23350.1 hypothetical protein SAMN04488590_0267 [Microbacterium sp. 77mftsu3.1]